MNSLLKGKLTGNWFDYLSARVRFESCRRTTREREPVISMNQRSKLERRKLTGITDIDWPGYGVPVGLMGSSIKSLT